MPIQESIERCSEIMIYRDGVPTACRSGEPCFLKILNTWKEMTAEAIQMPAFGVSIDNLTRKEMTKGIWVEFKFQKDSEFDGMPFQRLLVSVKPENTGFNLIRYWDGGYNGRCFYLDLRKRSMKDFYSVLMNL